MGPRFGSSLRTRIAAVVGLLFFGGIGLITLFVTRILHDEMRDMVSKQQLTAATYIARDIDAKLTLRLESLQRVALNIPPQLFTSPPLMQTWLEDRKAIHTLFPIGLMVVPPDGGPSIGDTPKLKTRPQSFVDRDWYAGVIATRKPFISKPLIARATNDPALVIALPIFDNKQQLLGILAGVTPLATPGFLNLILGTSPGKNGSYQLISPQHRLFVLTSDKETAISALPNSGVDPIIDSAIAGLRGTKVIRNADDEDELATIIEVPRTGWLLLARQPGAEAFEPVSNALRNMFLITTLLAIPIVIILLAALSSLLRPIAQLAGELHDMADGTRPMHPVATHSSDEVADVANSFNRLQSKLLEQEKRLAEIAHHDPLTGLPNRLLINDRLDSELRRIHRTGHGLALLFLDLDGFKPVNDAHGHQVGDLLLIEIAKRLKTCVRDLDTVARLGGDEFLILLSDTETSQAAAERVAQQCISALAAPFRISDTTIAIGVSIGIAACEGKQVPSLSADQLVSAADVAMYQAKANGRNRYAIHPAAPSPQET